MRLYYGCSDPSDYATVKTGVKKYVKIKRRRRPPRSNRKVLKVKKKANKTKGEAGVEAGMDFLMDQIL